MDDIEEVSSLECGDKMALDPTRIRYGVGFTYPHCRSVITAQLTATKSIKGPKPYMLDVPEAEGLSASLPTRGEDAKLP